jgi:hypothetical protein
MAFAHPGWLDEVGNWDNHIGVTYDSSFGIKDNDLADTIGWLHLDPDERRADNDDSGSNGYCQHLPINFAGTDRETKFSCVPVRSVYEQPLDIVTYIMCMRHKYWPELKR